MYFNVNGVEGRYLLASKLLTRLASYDFSKLLTVVASYVFSKYLTSSKRCLNQVMNKTQARFEQVINKKQATFEASY